MQDLLTKMIGRRVDIYCGGASSLRGEVIGVESGVLHIKENDQLCHIAIDKIVVVWEARDQDEHRAGFIPAIGAK